MNRLHALFAPALLALAACGAAGSGEDFAVEVKGKPVVAYTVLSAARVGPVAELFPGLTFSQSRPSENEILYTIPMKGHGDAKPKTGTVRLRLEPGKDGISTVVHATVDVPPMRMLLGKANMVLSETKVENQLRKVLDRIGGNLAAGSNSPSLAEPLAELLAAVAIAGNSDLQALANQAKRNPPGLDDLFADPEAAAEGAVDSPARDITADPGTVESVEEREPVEPAEPAEPAEAEVPVE